MRVLVECDADEAVLRALGVTKKQLLHFGGKDKLINRLRNLSGAVGVVDEDWSCRCCGRRSRQYSAPRSEGKLPAGRIC